MADGGIVAHDPELNEYIVYPPNSNMGIVFRSSPRGLFEAPMAIFTLIPANDFASTLPDSFADAHFVAEAPTGLPATPIAAPMANGVKANCRIDLSIDSSNSSDSVMNTMDDIDPQAYSTQHKSVARQSLAPKITGSESDEDLPLLIDNSSDSDDDDNASRNNYVPIARKKSSAVTARKQVPFESADSPILNYSPLPMEIPTPSWKRPNFDSGDDLNCESDGTNDVPGLIPGSDSENDEPPALMENSDDEYEVENDHEFLHTLAHSEPLPPVPSPAVIATTTTAKTWSKVEKRCNDMHIAMGHPRRERMVNTIKSKGISECGITVDDINRFFDSEDCMA
ncbi:MAG: hypothetical protein ACK56F_17300, partial [bacterium]